MLAGVRKTVPGLVGQSLLDVANMHSVELDGACRGGGRPKFIRRTDKFLEDESQHTTIIARVQLLMHSQPMRKHSNCAHADVYSCAATWACVHYAVALVVTQHTQPILSLPTASAIGFVLVLLQCVAAAIGAHALVLPCTKCSILQKYNMCTTLHSISRLIHRCMQCNLVLHAAAIRCGTSH
eukprot:12675-Heterococcus_DN1.PRE.7